MYVGHCGRGLDVFGVHDHALTMSGEPPGVAMGNLLHGRGRVPLAHPEDRAGVVKRTHQLLDPFPVTRWDELNGFAAREPTHRDRRPGRQHRVDMHDGAVLDLGAHAEVCSVEEHRVRRDATGPPSAVITAPNSTRVCGPKVTSPQSTAVGAM